MLRRILLSIPCPFVGQVVNYRNGRDDPEPAIVHRIRRPPTVTDPLGAVVDLLLLRPEGNCLIESARSGYRSGEWHLPVRQPLLNAVIEVPEEEDLDPRLEAIAEAPSWYRKLLGMMR